MAEAAAAEYNDNNGPNASEPPFNYRWEHVTTVVTLALKLAELVGADRDIVEAAAWLHDITKRDGEVHAQSGAAFARSFLSQTDFPPEKIEQVARAIADHKGLWLDQPLTEMAFHWTGMALAGDGTTTMADLIAGSRIARWQEKTVASMHTEPARRAARSRFVAYNRLWAELDAELKGDDISPEQSR